MRIFGLKICHLATLIEATLVEKVSWKKYRGRNDQQPSDRPAERKETWAPGNGSRKARKHWRA
jgi:hypothetical protein